MKETFFQICVMITIMMFVFSLAVSYVSGLGIYGDVEVKQGVNIDDDSNANDTVHSVTKSPDYLGGLGVNNIFIIVLTGAGIAGLVIAWLLHSAAILGVFVFSAAFWASYGNMLSIINVGSYVDSSFILIGTSGMAMIWIGAVAGMLTGSG